MENLGGARSAEYTEAITTGATGTSVVVHPINNKSNVISCTMVAGANTGKFQVTTSPVSSISAGTATWQDWPLGTVTGTITDVVMGPVTGLRGVSVAGAVNIEIVL